MRCANPVFDGKILQSADAVGRTKVFMLSIFQCLKLKVGPGIRILILGQTVMLARGKQQFKVHAPCLNNRRRICPDHHVRSCRYRTGCHQRPCTLNFNKTNPARPCRGCAGLQITKCGDKNPVSFCHLKDRFTRFKRKLLTIYDDYVFGHFYSRKNKLL